MIPPVYVMDDAGLRSVVEAMKNAARALTTRAAPKYSKTVEEGVVKSLIDLSLNENVFTEGCNRMVVFRGYQQLNILALTIEEIEGRPAVWHLSMSAGTVQGASKLDDALALRFARAFDPGLVECPPEGVFEYVRHFRGPCQQD